MKLSEHISISRRAFKMMFDMEPTYTLCLIFGAFVSAAMPYVPIWFSARIVDALFAKVPVKEIILLVGLTVGLTFLIGLLKTWLSSMEAQAEAGMYRAESWQYSQKAMEMAYESTEDSEVTRLRERIKRETQTGYNRYFLYECVRRFISSGTKIAASLALTASFFMLETIPVYMKLGLTAMVVLIVLSGITVTARSAELDKKYSAGAVQINVVSAKYGDYISDYAAGEDIRLYDMAESTAEAMAKLMEEFRVMDISCSIKKAVHAIPQTVLNDVLKFILYLILIFAALKAAVSVGSIAQYVSSIMLLLDAIALFTQTVQLSLVNHTYLKRYFSYFDIPNPMYQGSLTVEKRDDNEYFVEFRDVSFRYPGTEQYAIRHLNLKFKIGEKLAVVGMNGSGKTTFIKLMCRLYDPTEGEILLNGVNIKKYDYDEYMSIFSIVFQDFQLFSFPLGQNVAASCEYDEKRVKACLDKAGFNDRFEAMKAGAETCLYKDFSDDGIEISGGEAQKIALARALYKDAPFMILDEPTAALDPVSEYEVFHRFSEIAGDKTTIYISHRLASCRFCDEILVFDQGQVVQHGAHEELVEDKSGKYYELWHAQAQYYVEK